ncbi:Saccharopine dehydrogenase [Balamuthia mandrillaris]
MRLGRSNVTAFFRSTTTTSAPTQGSAARSLRFYSSSSSSPSSAAAKKTLHFWLRAEQKPNEHRTLLLPEHVAQLLSAGHRVTVERSHMRCIPDEDYARLRQKGGTLLEMAEEGSWASKAPKEAVIIGLKELPEEREDRPLVHRHVYFAHCYKGQRGSEQLLRRFHLGGGRLWDLEFLVDEQGKRVASFSHAAGKVGMGLGLLCWAYQRLGEGGAGVLPPQLKPYESYDDLCAHARELVEAAAVKSGGERPSVLVMGAAGRSGTGAVTISKKVGVTPVEWDRKHTQGGGPFPQLLQHHIFANCIYLDPTVRVPPFLTTDLLRNSAERRLSVIADVSCDTTNPNNPLPFSTENTTFRKPTQRVIPAHSPDHASPLPLDVLAIDHLPSLVPQEASREFGDLMIGHLLAFDNTAVWHRAEKLFGEHLRKHGLTPSSA